MRNWEISVDKVKDSYRMLSSEDIDARSDANAYLMMLYQREEIWPVCKAMISAEPDPSFQFLGAQLLYQKVSSEVKSLPTAVKIEVRDFVLGQLKSAAITLSATVDRLASVCALLGCFMLLEEWPAFMHDVFAFMKISDYCLQAGLFILERFPEELRTSNRLGAGQKAVIIEEALKHEQQMVEMFRTILGQSNSHSASRCLKAMAAWAEAKLNFMKYPELIKIVLTLSLQDFGKLESALNMVFETIRGSSLAKMEGLSAPDPSKELEAYSQPQIESVKLLMAYIMENRANFLGSGLQPEQVETFASIIRQALLDFGFLMCEPVGFELLLIILNFTASPDLRTSRNNFEFWVDFSEKIGNSKLSVPIKQQFAAQMFQAFTLVNQKAIVPDFLLDDPDLKEDLTVDDVNNVTVSEYRKDAVSFYQAVYDFFLKLTGKSDFFFEQCFSYIQKDVAENKLAGGAELGLFCIKSAAESMVSEEDSVSLRRVIGFVMERGKMAPPRVVAEIMLLIRDCTREIKDEQGFSVQCLQYCIEYLSDESLSYYASDAFKCLLETFTVVHDAGLVDSLLSYYAQTHGLKEIIIDKVVDGIVSIIFKIPSVEGLQAYIKKFMGMVMGKFERGHQLATTDPSADKPYFTALVEVKAVLDNYDGCSQDIKSPLRPYFSEIAKNSLQMIDIVIPYCLRNEFKFILMNELGLSCSIFKYVMRICSEHIDPLFLNCLDHTLAVLTPQKVVEMGAMLALLNESLITLTGRNLHCLDEWIRSRFPQFNQFFLQYFKSASLCDPDAVRRCYEVEESLLLYNSGLFLGLDGAAELFECSLHFLRHINEQKMQRKLVNFLYLCMQIPAILHHHHLRVLEVAVACIPILHTQSAANFCKILMLVLRVLSPEQQRHLLQQNLSKGPFAEISKTTLGIEIESVLLGLAMGNERYVMMVVKELTEVALHGENPQGAMQMEFRYNLWKKELAKMRRA